MDKLKDFIRREKACNIIKKIRNKDKLVNILYDTSLQDLSWNYDRPNLQEEKNEIILKLNELFLKDFDDLSDEDYNDILNDFFESDDEDICHTSGKVAKLVIETWLPLPEEQ